jgi:hypothetical protein
VSTTVLPPPSDSDPLPRIADHDDEEIDWWDETEKLAEKTAWSDRRKSETARPAKRT